MKVAQHFVIYDDECRLCNNTVRFFRNRDHQGKFRFLPMADETARQLIKKYSLESFQDDTVIYLAKDRLYNRSDAAIRMLMALGGVYRLGASLLLFPRPFRDYIYQLVARNRNKWFGNATDQCEI